MDEDCNYIINAGGDYYQDNDGNAWNPPTRNIMSYTNRACRTDFSPSQIAIMWSYIQDDFLLQDAAATGPSLLCLSDEGDYTLINAPTDLEVTWLVSTNLTIVSGQGTAFLRVRAVGNGSGWVRPTINGELWDVELNQFNVLVQNTAILTTTGMGGTCYEPVRNFSYSPIIANVNYNWILNTNKLSISSGNGMAYLENNTLQDGQSVNYTLTLQINDPLGCTISSNTRTGVFYKPTLCDCGYDDPSCGGRGGPPSPLIVFPNPTDDDLEIENTSAGEFKYHIYSNTNELILTDVSKQGKVRKFIGSLQPGIYYLVIVMADGTEHRHKIVKQ